MQIEVRELSHETESTYNKWLDTVTTSLIYHGLPFRNFLKQILQNANDHYLLAFADEQLVAALPCFSYNGIHGTVVNSLPFFGSNGSIVAGPECSKEIVIALLKSFDNKCRSLGAIASTIITNPLDQKLDRDFEFHADFLDYRIGQLTTLPDCSPEETSKKLMEVYHSKTRNLVRKGQKSGFTVTQENTREAMHELYLIHKANMASIGGKPKSWVIFEAIMDNFEAGAGYSLYTARKEGRLAAGLLVLFGNKTVEYFTPAIDQDFRSDQPLSLIIFQAMQDATNNAYENWNWGGTWSSQKGVYHFKSRWGTKDFPYTYNVKVYDKSDKLLQCTAEELLESYPYFYVIPFSEISLDG